MSSPRLKFVCYVHPQALGLCRQHSEVRVPVYVRKRRVIAG